MKFTSSGVLGSCATTSDCTSPYVCENNVCKAALGINCVNTGNCVNGLTCSSVAVGATNSLRCVNHPTGSMLNETCVPYDAPCAGNMICSGATLTSPGICKSATGGSCAEDSDCLATAGQSGSPTCVGNVCKQQLSSLNETCHTYLDCEQTPYAMTCEELSLNATSGVCRHGLGEPCTSGSDCFLGRCTIQDDCCVNVNKNKPDEKVCIFRAGGSFVNEPCMDQIDCSSNYTDPITKQHVPLSCSNGYCTPTPKNNIEVYPAYFYLMIVTMCVLTVIMFALAGHIVVLKKKL